MLFEIYDFLELINKFVSIVDNPPLRQRHYKMALIGKDGVYIDNFQQQPKVLQW